MRTYPAPPVSFYRHYPDITDSETPRSEGSRDTHGRTRAHTGTRMTQTNLTTIQTHLQLSYRVLPKSWLLHAPCSKGSTGAPLMRLCRTVGLRRARDLFGPGSGGLGWGEGA